MAAVPDSSSDDAAFPPWYPHALVDRTFDPSTFGEGLPSPWGRFYGWDTNEALSVEWWSGEAEGRWGAWPTSITSITVVSQHRWGTVIHLDDAWVAHLYPFQTGRDVSTLALYEPWKEALSASPLLLPIAGLKNQRGDQLAVFPLHSSLARTEVEQQPHQAVQAVGAVQAALVPFATPNTERRWNDRLKSVEDRLKTTTLWRAPHTRHVVGLPSVHAGLDHFALEGESMVVIPLPRSLVDHLLAPDERLPGVATIAMMEQRFSMNDLFASTGSRQSFYEAWGTIVPSTWTSPGSLSTANGGVWIWRYHAMLLMLAEARAYGLAKQAKQCDRWLFDVSRIQARLGELRTVHALRKGGAWAAVAAAILGSGPIQIPFILGAVGVAVAAHVVHQRRMPPPF
jgi:hypothetical protein